ncbi:MAG TPA: Mur ligase domain-containing protein [Candidatus Limnocylindrales bacterium]|nr:Mur ligase domain-containing protein [Candidatus Limnocylindrales bacterium]
MNDPNIPAASGPNERPLAGHRYHFSGVGGSGMAPLAMLALSLGATVTGSDRNLDRGVALHVFEELRRAGVTLLPQDGSGVVENLTAFVHSTAIEKDSPDFARAVALDVPRIRRGSFLARLAASRRTVAIAGTSGKSTVTVMTAHILVVAGYDPSFLGGGAAVQLNGASPPGSLRVGGGEWFVVETDESDGSVAEFTPAIAALTNLSRDHKEIDETARNFESLLTGTTERAVIHVSDPLLERVAVPSKLDVLRVAMPGLTWAEPHLRVERIKLEPAAVEFFVGDARARVPFPGILTVENALLAIGAAVAAGVPLASAAAALTTFAGVRRRLERIGSAQGVDVYDDFAHNPVKIRAALRALRPSGALRVYYQPHGYGPTRFFAAELTEAFQDELRKPGDRLFLAPIYDAGGTADRSIRSEDLVRAMRERGVPAEIAPSREEASRGLVEGARSGDRILVMGARDDTLPAFARSLYAALVTRDESAAAQRDNP